MWPKWGKKQKVAESWRVSCLEEKCPLLVHYATSSFNFLPKFRETLTPEDGTDRFPETSVRNYHYSLRNDPEERTSHLLCGGSLKSRALGWGLLGKQRRKLKGNSKIHRGEIVCEDVSSVRLISGCKFLVFSLFITWRHKLIKCWRMPNFRRNSRVVKL